MPEASSGLVGVFILHALYKSFGQIHVVVGNKDYLADELRHLGYVYYTLDQVLPRLVGRMSLAGKDELHRTVRIVDYLIETVQITEQQVRSRCALL